jgi:hypothetical protein
MENSKCQNHLEAKYLPHEVRWQLEKEDVFGLARLEGRMAIVKPMMKGEVAAVVVIVLEQVGGLAMSLALAKLKLQVEDFYLPFGFNFDCDIICYDGAPRMAMAISWPHTMSKQNKLWLKRIRTMGLCKGCLHKEEDGKGEDTSLHLQIHIYIHDLSKLIIDSRKE